MWRKIAGGLVLLTLWPGCAALREGRRVAATQPGTQPLPSVREVEVGEIALVRSSPVQFVLIRCGSPVVLPRKAALECRGSETVSAQLSLSAERRREYLVADIVSGAPAKGDRVYFIFPEGTMEAVFSAEGSGAEPAPTEFSGPRTEAAGDEGWEEAWGSGATPPSSQWSNAPEEIWEDPESFGSDPFAEPGLPEDQPRDVEWE
ncbi:MAG TPA: hypothetical protein VMN36_07135 [Verrucomicrobiales bacterium]|nr:hypothetical protein [Verrucomicrobiales bacterium]